ncbi:MAG: energy-coupling factor transporter transmembrane protein EcfT, partial [Anaerolineae bacterium]|nr:energy-coupling factor transporter transmembrane protein EcfT [Anaerolineae bacterium]
MHPLAWICWVGAGATATLLTRNPFYLVLLFAIFMLVRDVERSVQQEGPGRAALGGAALGRTLPVSPLRLALFAIPAGAAFNLLTSHAGETVLFRLPSRLPLLGGAFTAEALVYGAINGLLLVTLFAAFAVLNLAISIRDLIAYVPRAFYPVAVVSAIAVTFVPNTVLQFQQVREAQAIRGHKMRGWRDWLPLFLPVLIGGLERALQLAEAMTARGFGGQPARRGHA